MLSRPQRAPGSEAAASSSYLLRLNDFALAASDLAVDLRLVSLVACAFALDPGHDTIERFPGAIERSSRPSKGLVASQQLGARSRPQLLVVATIALIGQALAPIRAALALIGKSLALVRDAFTLVIEALARVSNTVSFVCEPLPVG